MIGVGRFIGIGVNRFRAGGGIPLASSALFWLDGTLDGAEFVDKSGNDRNFTITDKDFTASYFPYKSAATISAPVGDATLIAADINNFLYDSGGDPNAIPVVSFFQNIDYEDKLFTRHIAQVTDGNGVETTEPSVKDIVLYDAVLTGADLTAANAYYGIPSESGVYKWVDATGNDTTGDGSKSNPWLTVRTSAGKVNDGNSLYLKTQLYDDEAGNYFYVATNCGLKAIGRAEFITTDVTYAIRTNSALTFLLQGFYLSASPASPVNAANGTLLEFKNLYLDIGAVTNGVYGLYKSFKDSIVKATTASSSLLTVTTTTINQEISGNLFIGTTGVYGIYSAAGTYGIITFSNNIIRSAATNLISLNATTGKSIILGNELYPETGNNVCILMSNGSIADIKYNTITPINVTNKVINLFNTAAEVIGNIINSGSITNTAGGDIFNNIDTATAVSSCKVNNNKILSKRTGSYHILIGKETSGVGDNVVSEIEVKENYIKSSIAYGVSQVSTHGVLVGWQQDVIVGHNFINGSYYGVILKGSTATSYSSGGVCCNIIKDSPICMYSKGVGSTNFINNTIYSTDDIFVGCWIGANVGGDEADNCVIKNNIFILLGSGNNIAIHLEAEGSNICDHNIYYCPNGTLQFNHEGVIKTFSEWQALGFDANGKVLTDEEYTGLFTDPDNDDFSLAVGSAAIGAGETLAAAYDDGLDASTDWGDEDTLPVVVTKQQTAPWDIGAYVS